MSKDNAKTIFVIDFDKINDHIAWLNSNRCKHHDYKSYPAKLLKVDFHACNFLKPYHIAPLACLIYEYQQKGFVIKLINIPAAIKDYFDAFNFQQFCKQEPYNHFPTPLDSKILPLWRIEQTAISVYPAEAQRYFENLHFDSKSLFSLSSSLAELMNNVFDHSESKIPGYTFTQYNTRNNEITSCVCDFGIGIPRKVNKYLSENKLETIDNVSALKKALEYKFSTLSKPHNRGYGWDNVFSIVKGLKSKILIISNNVLYKNDFNKAPITSLLNNNFPGTIIVIYLNTLNLPQKEEEITDELIIL
ncbi:MAG TPA: hypothetical protein PKW80_12175 [Bacteroidales bacterium]|nr:hypothetical protein [Bacteroidales bacterium]